MSCVLLLLSLAAVAGGVQVLARPQRTHWPLWNSTSIGERRAAALCMLLRGLCVSALLLMLLAVCVTGDGHLARH